MSHWSLNEQCKIKFNHQSNCPEAIIHFLYDDWYLYSYKGVHTPAQHLSQDSLSILHRHGGKKNERIPRVIKSHKTNFMYDLNI